MAKITINNPVIPLDSTILVASANGLIASHIVDQVLAAGYHVRGTVRDPAKCAWMESLYSKRYGPGRFELAQVSDITAPGAWDSAVQGVSGIVDAAGAQSFVVPDIDRAIKSETSIHTGLLEAAKKEPSVKSFVLTSSAWAVWTPDASKKIKLTESTWNEEGVKLAYDTEVPPREKLLAPLMAVKTRMEQGIWAWIEKEKPTFRFNTILPDTVIGECLDPANQGIPSTAGMVLSIWEGSNRDMLNGMQPQWHVDTRDTGLLFLAALVVPGVDRERIFAFGDRYSWFQVAEILRKLHPGKKIAPVKYIGIDQTEVPNQRGADLLGALGQKGWTSLEESVKANSKSFS